MLFSAAMTTKLTLDDTVVVEPDTDEPATSVPETVTQLSATEVVIDPFTKDALIAPTWVEPQQDWPHQWIEYKGDRLAVRKPTQTGMAGFSLGSSPHNSQVRRNNLAGLFMSLHMADGTWWRAHARMMNPDETEYEIGSIGEIVAAIIELATEPAGSPAGNDGKVD